MNNKTRAVTLTGLLTALIVVFIYIASVLPTGRWGLVAVSSLFAVAAVIEMGIGSAVFVFIASGVLSALLVPVKTEALIYVLFFGYYPIIKSLSERLKPFALCWGVKLLVFNAALTAVWFLFRALLVPESYLSLAAPLIYLAGNAVFVLFDIGLTQLIVLYVNRISKNIRMNRGNRR
jgi:hypothetical protein